MVSGAQHKAATPRDDQGKGVKFRMEKKKLTFSEPGCIRCPSHMDYGTSRYCGGFKNKKRRKSFRKSDPAYKAPKWCPKRKEPHEYRIYGFADEQGAVMELIFEQERLAKQDYVFPNAWHYKLRTNGTTQLTPKAFYEKANSEDGVIDRLFTADEVHRGEVVELDTGLARFFFYCAGPCDFRPASFHPEHVKDAESAV